MLNVLVSIGRSLRAPLAAALFALAASSAMAVEYIAHRGASYDAPENTLAAMKLAWEQKTDALECDIYLSGDGKIVVMHDADTLRTTGVRGKIAEKSWDTIKNLDAGSWKGREFAGEPVPTLDSILATVPRGKRIFIEIKCGSEILPELARVIKVSGKRPSQIAIITFKLEVAREAKLKMPFHQVYYLQGWSKSKTTGEYPNIDTIIRDAKAARLDGLDLDYRFPIDEAFVKKVRRAGLDFYIWTLDDPAEGRRLAKAGIDGITTNRPRFMRDEMGRK